MANIRNSNSFFIDTAAANHLEATAENLPNKNLKLLSLTVTAIAATTLLSLKDVITDEQKLIIRLDIVDKVQFFDFSRAPIVFPNGIHPETVTDCVATCVIQESQS